MILVCSGVEAEIKGSKWTCNDYDLQMILEDYTDIILSSTDPMLHIPDIAKYIVSFIMDRMNRQGIPCYIADRYDDAPEVVTSRQTVMQDMEKKYLRDGDIPPKWAKVEHGPRGGIWYDPTKRPASFTPDSSGEPIPSSQSDPDPVYLPDRSGNPVPMQSVSTSIKEITGEDIHPFTLYALHSTQFRALYGNGTNNTGAVIKGSDMIVSDALPIAPIREMVYQAYKKKWLGDDQSVLKQGAVAYVTKRIAAKHQVESGDIQSGFIDDLHEMMNMPDSGFLGYIGNGAPEEACAAYLASTYQSLFPEYQDIEPLYDALRSELSTTIPGMGHHLETIHNIVSKHKPVHLSQITISEDDWKKIIPEWREYQIRHAGTINEVNDTVEMMRTDPGVLRQTIDRVQSFLFAHRDIPTMLYTNVFDQMISGGVIPPGSYTADVPFEVKSLFSSSFSGDIVSLKTWLRTSTECTSDMVVTFRPGDQVHAALLNSTLKEYLIDRNQQWKVISKTLDESGVTRIEIEPVEEERSSLDPRPYAVSGTLDDEFFHTHFFAPESEYLDGRYAGFLECNDYLMAPKVGDQYGESDVGELSRVNETIRVLSQEIDRSPAIPSGTRLYLMNSPPMDGEYLPGDEVVQNGLQQCSLSKPSQKVVFEYNTSGNDHAVSMGNQLLFKPGLSFRVTGVSITPEVIDTGSHLSVTHVKHVTVEAIDPTYRVPVANTGGVEREDIRYIHPIASDELRQKLQDEYNLNHDMHPRYGYGDKPYIAYQEWCGSGHRRISSYLRHGTDPEVNKHLPVYLDAYIDTSPPLPDGLVLYRGIGDKTAGNMICNMTVGDIICDKSYMSFSYEFNVAKEFSEQALHVANGKRVIMRMVTKAGDKGAMGVKGEHEIILPREKQMVIRNITVASLKDFPQWVSRPDEQVYIYDVEYIDPVEQSDNAYVYYLEL